MRIDFVIGCTACGKGQLARALAERISAEIVSVDSMKVYRRMDIGTAKPSPADRQAAGYHLIDVVEPSESFSVARFVDLADAAIADVVSRRKRVLAVGGTALYMKALSEGLFEGPSGAPELRAELHARGQREGADALHAELTRIDPAAAARVHRNDLRRIVRALEVYHQTGTPISELQTQWGRTRPRYECRFVGLRRTKQDQNHRINQRVKRMIELGLVDEVRSLLAESKPLSKQARQALGYAQIIDHLEKGTPLDDAVESIKIGTRRFAKSQRTWFRSFRSVQWIDAAADDTLDQLVGRVLRLLATREGPG